MQQALFQPPALAPDYPIQLESDCIEPIESSHHDSLFPGGAASEQVRRDGSLNFSLNPGNGSRYLQHRSTFNEGHYAIGSGNPEPNPLPISGAAHLQASATFPPFASNFHQLPFSSATHYPTTFPQHYPNAGGISHSYRGLSSAMPRLNPIPDLSSSALPSSGRPLTIGNPISPSLSGSTRNGYTNSTAQLNRHNLSPRGQAEGLTRTSHGSLPDGSRNFPSGPAMPLPSPPASSYGGVVATVRPSFSQGNASADDTPPFPTQRSLLAINCDGQKIVPNIEAKAEKGFFLSGDTWTCYRRNYFTVQCQFTLTPHIPNGRLHLERAGEKGSEQIQALAIRLSAAVDQPGGKVIELIQHTPKRDKGPQMPIKFERLCPTPPVKADAQSYGIGSLQNVSTLASPFLPLQHDGEQSTSSTGPSATAHQHTFERIQFKTATANNGKRRAAQQYYHLIVELHADVRGPRDAHAIWVKVAERISARMVVRGRSPSHYQNEGPHSNNNNNSSRRGPGGNGTGTGGGSHAPGGLTSSNLGSRGVPHGLPYPVSGERGSSYRGSHYSLDPSSVGSHSISSASSMSGGPADGIADEAMDDAYQYFSGPLYESELSSANKSHAVDSVPKRVRDEPTNLQSFSCQWQMGACGRSEGARMSRSYHSDLNAGC